MKQKVQDSILYAARMTPTGDNCQPFTFAWSENTLHVNHDNAIALHKLNHENFSSLLALGCLFENVKITAADNSFETEFNFDPKNPLGSVQIVFKESATVAKTGLSDYIDKRKTDRRLYEKGWDANFASELQEIAKNYKASVKIVETLSTKVTNHLLNCDQLFWKNTSVFFDTIRWIRFSQASAIKTKDGLPAKNLELNIFNAAILWLASRNFVMQKIFRYSGAIIAGKQLLKNQLSSAGGFFLFYPKSFSPTDLINMAQLAQRLWLELTRKGFVAQPITLGTLMPYLAKNLDLKNQFDEDNITLLKNGAQVMQEELSLPAWGLRWGKVKAPLSKESSTYRRDL